MKDLFLNILIVLFGAILGFILNWFLAERKERYELRRSIAPSRVAAYQSLWILCKKELKPEERPVRVEELWNWYNNGGGLFLSLNASERFFSAVKLMGMEELQEPDLKEMQEHLTWLRTEMKYHIGSYTYREKKTQIRDSK